MPYEKHPCLVGITGYKGSGKDTAASSLIDKAGYTRVAFAGALKAMLRAALEHMAIDSAEIERMVDGDLKEEPFYCLSPMNMSHKDIIYCMIDALLYYQGFSEEEVWRMWRPEYMYCPSLYFTDKSLAEVLVSLEVWAVGLGGMEEPQTPRHIMQQLGTEWGRNTVAEDYWLRVTDRRVKLFDKVVMTDMRFPNEADYVGKKGGHRLRVVRDGHAADHSHASERFIDELPVDQEIINGASIDELRAWTLSHVLEWEALNRIGGAE